MAECLVWGDKEGGCKECVSMDFVGKLIVVSGDCSPHNLWSSSLDIARAGTASFGTCNETA